MMGWNLYSQAEKMDLFSLGLIRMFTVSLQFVGDFSEFSFHGCMSILVSTWNGDSCRAIAICRVRIALLQFKFPLDNLQPASQGVLDLSL